MRVIGRFAVAALSVAVLTGPALAADVITIPTSDSPMAMPVYDDPGFDWAGFYAGVYGGLQESALGGEQLGLGVQAGFNAQFDFYLLGAEVSVHGLADAGAGDSSYGQILGRAGLVVSDDVLVYGAGGYGIDLGAPNQSNTLIGGGVELAVTDTISVEAQYLHGFPLNGGNETNQFTVGANFHF